MYINKAMVYGNLTRDPELRSLPSGTSVCSFGLATNRVYNDRDGNRQEEAEFHNIVVFGRQAETTAQYLKKGSSAFIDGRLRTSSWEKDGQKQYRTEIIADRVQFGPRSGATTGGMQPAEAPPKPNTSATKDKADDNPPDYPEDEIKPEDIPF